MRRWCVAVAVLAVVTTILAGCTSSTWDTSGIDDATTTVPNYPRTDAGLTASLTAYLSTVGDDLDEWAPPKAEAECAATRLVHRLTTDHLLEIGFDPRRPSLALGYPADERTAVVNILVGCIDFSKAILETVSSFQKLPLTQTNCLATGFTRLGLVRDLAGSLVDGKEIDPFANDNRYGNGVSSLAVECLGDDDLLPAAPMPLLPGPSKGAPTTSTSTTVEPRSDSDGLGGITPGGPLDSTTTTEATGRPTTTTGR
ncbi:MAG: hypothetical protein U0Q22_18775 [Acidimicrobiales bacterium]